MRTEKVLAKNPILVGVVGSYRFYAFMYRNDDYPLIVDDGKSVHISFFYHLPTLEELQQTLRFGAQGE